MGNILDKWHADTEAARAREMERRARTGFSDPWWDAPHYTRRWLKEVEVTDDPEGELIAGMRADPDLPHHFWGLKQMRLYARRKSGGDEAVMAAVLGVWRRYKKWCRQKLGWSDIFPASRGRHSRPSVWW
jgi:hypothetical protein